MEEFELPPASSLDPSRDWIMCAWCPVIIRWKDAQAVPERGIEEGDPPVMLMVCPDCKFSKRAAA